MGAGGRCQVQPPASCGSGGRCRSQMLAQAITEGMSVCLIAGSPVARWRRHRHPGPCALEGKGECGGALPHLQSAVASAAALLMCPLFACYQTLLDTVDDYDGPFGK